LNRDIPVEAGGREVVVVICCRYTRAGVCEGASLLAVGENDDPSCAVDVEVAAREVGG
jgi:hypothetical protein